MKKPWKISKNLFENFQNLQKTVYIFSKNLKKFLEKTFWKSLKKLIFESFNTIRVVRYEDDENENDENEKDDDQKVSSNF